MDSEPKNHILSESHVMDYEPKKLFFCYIHILSESHVMDSEPKNYSLVTLQK